MIELYSLTDVARIFGLRAAQLRYWIQRGVLTPSVRRSGRFLYSFTDLVQVKLAVVLHDRGVEGDDVRRALVALRAELPAALTSGIALRVVCDGETVAVTRDTGSAELGRSDVLCSFTTEALRRHVDARCAAKPMGAPEEVIDQRTEPHEQPCAYQCFVRACQAEDVGRDDLAEIYYERCLALESSFAAVHTNLGNIYFERGECADARRAYQTALELEPELDEARYNLANLLDDEGETERAIAELRKVVSRRPEFADAHFNLGVILARVGGVAQARSHFLSYLDHDELSPWADRAREYIATLTHAPVARA